MTFGEPITPCGDCVDGRCTMNCSTPMKPGSIFPDSWKPAEKAPRDGTHILVCRGPYSKHWTFNQSPPAVVHYWTHPGANEDGFYLSNGGTDDDLPFEFTHWRPLDLPPKHKG